MVPLLSTNLILPTSSTSSFISLSIVSQTLTLPGFRPSFDITILYVISSPYFTFIASSEFVISVVFPVSPSFTVPFFVTVTFDVYSSVLIVTSSDSFLAVAVFFIVCDVVAISFS